MQGNLERWENLSEDVFGTTRVREMDLAEPEKVFQGQQHRSIGGELASLSKEEKLLKEVVKPALENVQQTTENRIESLSSISTFDRFMFKVFRGLGLQ